MIVQIARIDEARAGEGSHAHGLLLREGQCRLSVPFVRCEPHRSGFCKHDAG